MKKVLKTALITIILLSAGTGALLYFLMNNGSQDAVAKQEQDRIELDEGVGKAFIYSTKEDAVDLNVAGAGKNVINTTPANPYDVNASAEVRSRIERLMSRTAPTFQEPMIAHNPYGISDNTFYFYFETNSPLYVRYCVTNEDSSINDFTRTVYNGNQDNLSKIHEFTVSGLVPGRDNYIVMSLVNEKNQVMEKRVYHYKASDSKSSAPEKMILNAGKSKENSSYGKYYVFPRDKSCILMYDNSGILRGEIPVATTNGRKIINSGDKFIYMYENNKIACIDKFGQVMGIYSSGYYELVDFDYDGFGNIYGIAKKQKKLYFIRINATTGKVSKVRDFDGSVKLSSVTLTQDGNAILGCTSPKGMIKVNGVASNSPGVDYVIGNKKDWKNTKYKKRVLEMEGEGSLGDVNTVLSYNLADSSGETVSLSYLNNNTRVKGNSVYTECVADGTSRKYKIAKSFDVPYASQGGSGEKYDGHYIVCSGASGRFGEYDGDGTLIKEFITDMPLRSVFKMDLKGVLFN